MVSENCSCPPPTDSLLCELPSNTGERPKSSTATCPTCKQPGKPVQGQTVKAMLVISLRYVSGTVYLFCRTRSCPVVYFTSDGLQTHMIADLRERVYQKEPEHNDVFVCYCFRHTVGEIREASPSAMTSLVTDITDGIQANQCACDLRNPQGSCCLGNVRGLLRSR